MTREYQAVLNVKMNVDDVPLIIHQLRKNPYTRNLAVSLQRSLDQLKNSVFRLVRLGEGDKEHEIGKGTHDEMVARLMLADDHTSVYRIERNGS